MAFDDLNDLSRRKQYVATAGQTVFPYPFPIFEDTDLVVYVNDSLQTVNANYTVSGEGNANGGDVVFVTALAADDVVTIFADTPIQRITAFIQGGAWTAARTNSEFNRLIAIVQELDHKISRTLRASVKEAVIPEMSDPDARANKFQYFDALGAPTFVTGEPTQPVTHERQISYPTEDQTVVSVAGGYTPGAGDLSVYLNGIRLVAGVDYAESSSTTITLAEGADDGDVIELAIGDVFDVTLAVTAKTSQDITATEGQTALTTNRSYVPGNDEIEVFLNGALLTPGSDYEETNSTTITMQSSLSDADQIRIIYGQSYNPTGALSADSIGRTLYPLTAGEIAGGVAPSDYSYPPGHGKRYGWVAGADCTSAIRNALLATDSTYGGEVIVPTGVGLITGGISSSRPRIKLRGEKGAELTVVGTGTFMTLTGDHVEIDGIRWTSTETTGNPPVAFTIQNASHAKVTNNVFNRTVFSCQSTVASAETGLSCTDNTFEGSYASWTGSDNANIIDTRGIRDVNISRNLFTCTSPERIAKISSSLQSNTTALVDDAWTGKRLVFADNILDVYAANGKQVIDLFTATFEVVIANNVISALGSWQEVIGCKAGGGTTTNQTPFSRGITITGNTITAATTGFVIGVQGAWGLVMENGNETVNITGNNIKHTTSATLGTIATYGYNLANIVGNVIERSVVTSGIGIQAYNNQISNIANNTLTYGHIVVRGTGSSSGGVAYSKQPQVALVTGNVIDDFKAEGAVMIYSCSGLEELVIADNALRNQTDDAVIAGAIWFTGTTAADLNIHDNAANLADTAKNIVYGSPTTTRYRQHDNSWGAGMPSVASATTVTLPSDGRVFNITGTTSITSVTASRAGREVVLKFAGALTFTDGSNLKLAGSMSTSADDTISLICDGTNWYETGRSAN